MADHTNPARTADALRLTAYLVDDVSTDDLARKLDGYVDLDDGIVDVTLGGFAGESRDQREDALILAAILLRYLDGLAE